MCLLLSLTHKSPCYTDFDFTDSFGLLVEVDLKKAKVTSHESPDDPFFVGFTNMALARVSNAIHVKGVTPHVEEDGICSDGCFAFGDLALTKAHYMNLGVIPFKAMMDDSHFYDAASNTFWIQGFSLRLFVSLTSLMLPLSNQFIRPSPDRAVLR